MWIRIYYFRVDKCIHKEISIVLLSLHKKNRSKGSNDTNGFYDTFPHKNISEFNTWFCALCEVYSGEKHLQRMSLSGAGILLCSFACINCMEPAKKQLTA